MKLLVAVLLGLGLVTGSASAQEVKALAAGPLTTLRGPEDAESAAPLESLRLVAPRNGTASTQFVLVGPDAALSAVEPEVTLAGLPPASIRVRYATVVRNVKELEIIEERSQGFTDEWALRYTNNPYYDVLEPEPRPAGGVIPVWVTVDVPANQDPGDCEGKLTVAGADYPVTLQVGAYRCPEPAEWKAHAGFEHCVEMAAVYYDLPLWSDGHWRHVERELKLMGRLGGDDMHVTAIPGLNYLGRKRPLVRFRRTADGGLEPDTSLLRRYVKLWDEHVGEPDSFVLQVWDPVFNGDRRRRIPAHEEYPVLVVDASGEVETVEVAAPGKDGAADIWQPLVAQVLELVQEVGWQADTLKLGFAHDQRPRHEVVRFYQRHFPDLTWALWTHGRGDSPPRDGELVLNGMPVGHYEHVYVPPLTPVETHPLSVRGGWNMDFPQYTSARLYLYQYSPLGQYRYYTDALTTGPGRRKEDKPVVAGTGGHVHTGLNYWAVAGGDGPLSRRGLNAWANFYRNSIVRAMIEPGPEGALPTVRFEQMREGMQEAEARIAIEQALLAGDLTDELRDECVELLRTRNSALSRDGKLSVGESYMGQNAHQRHFGLAQDWQTRALELFNLAGRVQ
jgi:hypothetical protein